MKKFASLVGAGAILLSFAGGVFAGGPMKPEEEILVVNKGGAVQITGSAAVANTGLNNIDAGMTFGTIKQTATIVTGDAYAFAGTQAIANQFVTSVKVADYSFTKNGPMPKEGPEGGIKVINDGHAFQLTGSLALASSGLNDISAGKNFGGIKQTATIRTGDAASIAESQAWANIFNTKVSSISSDTYIGSMWHPMVLN